MPMSPSEAAKKGIVKLASDSFIQIIRSTSISPGPTSVRISFKTTQDTKAMVQLFDAPSMSTPDKSGLEIFSPSKEHEFFFRGLEQKKKYWFRITAGGQPGPAERTGTFVTGARTADVLFHKLHVRNDGDPAASGEMRFFAWVYDNITDARLTSDVRFPATDLKKISSGDEFPFPFGSQPQHIDPAPDELALYADGMDDDASTFPFSIGFHEPPRVYFKKYPYHLEYDYYAAAGAVTVAQLPDDVGDTSQDVVLDSGNWAIAFSLLATIHTSVIDPSEAPKLNAKELVPETLWETLQDEDRTLTMAPGSGGMIGGATPGPRPGDRPGDFVTLAPNGSMYARTADPRQADNEARQWRPIGGDHLATVTLVGTGPGESHVFGRRTDGTIVHTTANHRKENAFGREWAELGGKAVGNIVAVPAKDSSIDLLVVDRDGAAWCASVALGRRRAPVWRNLGGRFESVTAVRTRNGALRVFGKARDGGVHGRAVSAANDRRAAAEWENLGGGFDGPLVATLSKEGEVTLIGFHSDRSAHVKRQNGKGWTPAGQQWTRVGDVDALDLSGGADRASKPRKAKGSPA